MKTTSLEPDMRLRATILITLSSIACKPGPNAPAPSIAAVDWTGAAKLARPAVKRALPVALRGRVAEKIDAGQYSYLRIQMADGAAWVAVPKSSVELGETVSISGAVWTKNFQSLRLGRTWGRMAFGVLEGNGPAADASPGAGCDKLPPARAMQPQRPC